MVKKNWLIVINGFLWMVAGMNIANIGVKSILAIDSLVWLLCVPVFAVFATMFFRIISKNCERILSMEGEKAKIYNPPQVGHDTGTFLCFLLYRIRFRFVYRRTMADYQYGAKMYL